jgi:hypothetical protein
MPHEQPTTGATPPTDAAFETHATATGAADAPVHEHLGQQEEWYEEPLDQELPRRPRRRLLTPIPLTLLAVLLIACGFIGGVLVEKGESSASGAGASSSLTSRFAALRSSAAAGAGGRGATGAAGTTGAFAGGGASGGSASGGGASGGGGATIGQVAYLAGSTLYVTTSEGNTVKVKTSAASTVTKMIKTDVKGIHPGETVIVTGSTGANGALSAESIRVGEAGLGGGLGAALFGGGRSSGGRGGRGGGSSSGEPALFGG